MEPGTNRFAKHLATQYGTSSIFGLYKNLANNLAMRLILDPRTNPFAKDLVIRVGTGLRAYW